MKFIGSLITTGVIATCVWGIALLQLQPAKAMPLGSKTTLEVKAVQAKDVSNTVETAKIKANADIKITGVSKHMSVGSVLSLWQTFNNDTALHQQLKMQPSKVYVFYRNFTKSYQEADITIGYLTQEMRQLRNVDTIASGSFDTLLTKGSYSNEEIAAAWKKIDYRNNLNAIVEIHQLDKAGTPIAVELLVQYH